MSCCVGIRCWECSWLGVRLLLRNEGLAMCYVGGLWSQLSWLRQALYIKHNNEAHSWNHCCSRKIHTYCIFWVSVCSLRYPVCNSNVPYCHLTPAQLYNIFANCLTNSTIFEKNVVEHKCVFLLYLQFLAETFLILRRIARDMIKNVYWDPLCKVHIILVRF